MDRKKSEIFSPTPQENKTKGVSLNYNNVYFLSLRSVSKLIDLAAIVYIYSMLSEVLNTVGPSSIKCFNM